MRQESRISTPALHGDTDAVADFYSDKATTIAIGMMLSLISVFFLAWFLASLRHHLADSEGDNGWISPLAWGGGVATLTLLAAGFALNSAGALRARESSISPDVAAVFYDSSLALTGLAASLAMAVLLAATAAVTLQFGAFPRWFGWVSAVLALLGIVTPCPSCSRSCFLYGSASRRSCSCGWPRLRSGAMA